MIVWAVCPACSQSVLGEEREEHLNCPAPGPLSERLDEHTRALDRVLTCDRPCVHDWRLINDFPDVARWYCTRCRLIESTTR